MNLHNEEQNKKGLSDAKLDSLIRTILMYSPVSIWIADKDGTLVYQNQSSRQLFGIERDEEILGKYNILHDEEIIKQGFMPEIEDVFTKGKSAEFILPYDFLQIKAISPQAKPTHKVLLVRINPLTDAEGHVEVRFDDYTARWKIEKDLEASEAKYRQLVEDVADWVWEVDTLGRYTYSSPAVENILGYKPEETIGKPTFDFIIPEDRESYKEAFEQAIRTKGNINKLINRNYHKDGSIRYLETNGKPIVDEFGRVTGFRGVDRDTTDRVRDQEAVRRSLEQYRMLFENNPQPMIVFDMYTQRILAVNDAAIAHYGYSKDEFLTMTIRDLHPQEDLPRFMELISQQAKGLVRTGYWRHKKKDGTIIDVEIVAHGVEWNGHQAQLAMTNDITDRKRAEDRLIETQRMLSTLMSNLPGMVYRCRNDHKWTMEFVSEGCFDLTGYEPSALLFNAKIAYGDIIHPDDRETVWEETQRNLANGGTFRITYRIITADGRLKWVWEQGRGILSPANNLQFIEGFITDITENKRAQEKEKELEDQQKDFYRRTILAATEGKLEICTAEKIEQLGGPAIAFWQLKSVQDLTFIRSSVARVSKELGMEEARIQDFVLAVGEATTNAVKHAGGGEARLHKVDDGLFFVVADKGRGIEALTLPEVALVRGYSTAGTLGMGYKAILSIADKVYLSTGPGGTTLGIEMKLRPQKQEFSFENLPDTWAKSTP
ncbi:MAG: PAS domain S-box protein [Armatimonadota bacterium]|jgi:PAS domain S-box-containing protein